MSTKDKEIRRLVISTVGTSLLTNQINSNKKSQSDWYFCLQDNANLTEKNLEKGSDIDKIIKSLKQSAETKLNEVNTIGIKEASAELNGIYGLYNDQLENGKLDHHVLITTDTAQGQVTANLVEKFLRDRKISVEVYTPEKLSTADNKVFNQGIDNLLDWLDRRVKEDKEKNYEIYFNLVGGFKALQGCMNTMGMFYADKIIYVFEGASSNLITIPRLPITVDYSRLTDHVPTLALLDAGAGLLPSKTKNIPEAMIAEIDGKMTISNWGQLIWNQCKDEFLSQKLQEFPRLSYDENRFPRDYNNISTAQEKVKLQETLAKVSGLLEESNGDTRDLVKSVSYSPYKGAKEKEVYHFYVGIHWRVSCKVSNGNLTLRYYGTHDYVEGKETN
ncbi:putative CRISPR-associated protein [Microcoleus sp. T3_B1]|uniref:putative CRISPR-associated protein n=1 Tax=unclassified Microcoleus TaxID=2642155 RepID=UPI002FD093E6